MTTLAKIELTCPVCTHGFASQKVVATNCFGGKRTDFHERASGHQPLPYKVHTCWKCGYTGPDEAFTGEGIDLSPYVIEQLMEEMPKYRGRNLTGSEKWEAAARAAEIIGEDDKVLAGQLLCAAWCCVDESDTEAERYFRIAAAKRFETALEAFDVVEREERAVITYLTGEVWRRAGFVERAHEWFRKVPDEVIDTATQQWIIDAAIQQTVAPREWWG
jgi:uncharacterized protein (DUF2225 family)